MSLPKAPIEVTVGQRCNVRRAIYGEPMVRMVTKAGWVKHKDGMWFEWRWKAEPRADGRMDCGYAGIREDGCREIELEAA